MNDDTHISRRSTTFSIILGILLVILGLFVLGSQIFATQVTVAVLGWVLVIAGAAEFFYSFFSGSFLKFFMHILGGSFAFIVGLILVTNPVLSAVSITLLIAVMLLVNGAVVMIGSAMRREHNWGWMFFGGVVTFLLGVAIIAGWPTSGLWIIGLLVGIQLIISGFMFMTAPAMVQEQRTLETTGYGYGAPYLSGAKGGEAEKDDTNDVKEKTPN